MFSEQNKVPEHCLKIEKWQGPPHVNRVKQYKLCFCLFSFFSHGDKESLSQSVSEDVSSTKL